MSPRGVPGLYAAAKETWESENDAVGFVLAGGRSTRMGADKAFVEFAGRPLIAHVLGVLASAGVPMFIAGAQPGARPLLEKYAPVTPDMEPGLGPLSGVCAALASVSAARGVFLPVDVPLLPSSLIDCLLRHARITDAAFTLTSVNGFPQTFPAVVARPVLPRLQRELREGRLGCLAAFQAAARDLGQPLSILPAEVLAQSGQVSHPEALPVVRWFLNLNSEQDVRVAASQRACRVS